MTAQDACSPRDFDSGTCAVIDRAYKGSNQVVSVILLEGVTGAGKTQTLQALSRHSEFSTLLGSGRVFDEEETFGEVMSEMQDPGVSTDQRFMRLERILEQLERHVGHDPRLTGFVLERFHLSYYVLLPDWDLYSVFDKRLARLNCLIVLLQFPESDIARRCLDREDRAATTWSEDMITHYGSRPATVEAIVQSTHRRREAAERSNLPILEIDTGEKLWDEYANQVVAGWQKL